MKQLTLVLLALLIGSLVLFFLYVQNSKSLPLTEPILNADYKVKFNSQTQHTKSILYFDQPEESTQYSDLESKISSYLNSNNLSDKSSLYFYNFEDGSWFGIRENQTIPPASLTKVLIAMVMYKIAESDPSFLTNEIVYNNEFDKSKNIEKENRLKKGTNYTYEELIEQMLSYSDNEAFYVLHKALSKEYESNIAELEKAFELDLSELIKMKSYSGLLKSLYYASYLNPKYSELMLQQLIDQEFQRGIVAPEILKETDVAHKFGFYNPSSGGTNHAFMHCGIFYSSTDYLLCISVRATSDSEVDSNKTVEATEKISEMVYRYIYNH